MSAPYVAPKLDPFGHSIIEPVRKLLERSAALPAQRTPEWHKMRETLMTASSVASIFKLSQIEIDLRDQGILELEDTKKVGQTMPSFSSFAKELRQKCFLEAGMDGTVHTEWGVAYEEIVKQLYQSFYNVYIHDFGLIPHPTLNWLGASPDGVTSSGKMIEIKCPYSRQPAEGGIPKCQYWVQTQIQMECCGFTDCDFLDIVLKEYVNKQHYLDDRYGEPGTEGFEYGRNASGMPKGFIIEWTRPNPEKPGKVLHQYFHPPVLKFKSQEEEQQWLDNWIVEYFTANPITPDRVGDLVFNLRGQRSEFFYIRYWYIEQWNVCNVKKNQEWLDMRLPEIKTFWDSVIKYRVEGLPPKYMVKSRGGQAEEEPSYFDATPIQLSGECDFFGEHEDIVADEYATANQTTKIAVKTRATPPSKKRALPTEHEQTKVVEAKVAKVSSSAPSKPSVAPGQTSMKDYPVGGLFKKKAAAPIVTKPKYVPKPQPPPTEECLFGDDE